MVCMRVGTSPNPADTFNVNVGPFPVASVPPNDSYWSATPVTAPQTILGTTVGATQDALNFGPSCGAFGFRPKSTRSTCSTT